MSDTYRGPRRAAVVRIRRARLVAAAARVLFGAKAEPVIPDADELRAPVKRGRS